ncbi:hypothetical protein E2I00_008031, partial [Balaenoptera physalus]
QDHEERVTLVAPGPGVASELESLGGGAFRVPVLQSSSFINLILKTIQWPHSLVCLTHLCWGYPPTTKDNMHFTSISVLSGCWYGMEDEEAFSVQSVSVEQMSLGKTPTPDPSIQKTHPCEKCVMAGRDILYLPEYQGLHPGQKSYTCEACGKQFWFSPNHHQHQKHNDEKPFKRDIDRASFVTTYRFHVSGKPFTCEEVGKDFLAMLNLLQHQATLKGAKPHSSS